MFNIILKLHFMNKDHSYIAKIFDGCAETYDQAAFIEQTIGQRLIERLTDISVTPTRILDLGCGTGLFTQQLQTLFPTAQIISVDFAANMLKIATRDRSARYCLQADAHKLPFENSSFDLIFANCCFNFLQDLPTLYLNLFNYLNKAGVLLFSTFGSGTFNDLGITHSWPDLFLHGDWLSKANFLNPVVDTENLAITYATLADFFRDVAESGNLVIDYSNLTANELTQKFSTNIEIIYGWATRPAHLQQYKDTRGNVYINADTIDVI